MKTQTIEMVKRKRITPLEGVRRIDREIGGITKVIWNPGANKHTIYNHTQQINLPVRGATRREYGLFEHLAVLAYLTAQSNGNWEPGQVHLNKGFSSKHHKFKYQALGILAKYSDTIERRCE